MAFLEWRRFNFFDVHKNVDEGKVAEALQDTSIEVCTSGNSYLVIGDANGWVRLITRAWTVTTFKAYEVSISLAVQLKQDPYLITIGEDEPGVNQPSIKVWDVSVWDRQGNPTCLRVSRAIPSHMRPTSATALAVHENKNLMAVGFGDGSVILFRGDITRTRSSKMKTLPDPGNTAISGLAFKGNSHLFVASRSAVVVYHIGSSGKEKAFTMDEVPLGCKPQCAVMADQQFVVARNDAIYCYTVDGKGPCYALDGEKKRVDWFRSYLVTISRNAKSAQAKQQPDEKCTDNLITILDIQNKFIVFTLPIGEVKGVITEWGAFHIITEDKQVHHLDEKDLQSKLSLLFKKNLYDVAIRIASNQQYDSDGLIDIHTQYGDHLYKKGDPKGAIEQYIKTIGKLETSYVIRKYLDSRHLEALTLYLQELHKKGLATEDHTTLLLTCFVKLDQHDQHGKLREFIKAKDRVIDFDIEIAIKVCRQVSTEDALYLSKKHHQHDWYLRIVTEDNKSYLDALDYISDLPFDDADYYMRKYGHLLIHHVPIESTQFLKILCTDYKPRNKPLVDDAMMAGVIARNQINKARPEDYIHLFLNNSEMLVEFLEYLVKCDSSWSTLIYNTLIEHYLHVWSSLSDPTALDSFEQKVINLLKNPDANYNKDQTLIICQMLNFKPGLLYLYEESKLFEQILRYHMSQGDAEAALGCCRRFGAQEPHLWVELLWWPPPPHCLTEILNVISHQKLLSPLLVIDCLSNSTTFTLGDIRKYLMDVLSSENEIITKETLSGEKYEKEAERGREALKIAAENPITCQASRCAACNHQLDLPARHFLCNHSYHQHCFQSFSENDMECPACVPNNKKLIEVLESHGVTPQTTEAFHNQLKRAQDCFTVVAEYFGRGVFNKLTFVSDNVPKESPVSETENSVKTVNIPQNKYIPPESTNYGPGAEARLRLEEGNNSRIVNTSSKKGSSGQTSIVIPASEGRMRLLEQKQRENFYSSSLEGNITHKTIEPPNVKSALGTTYMNTSSDFLDADSKHSTPQKNNSPLLLKNKSFGINTGDNISNKSVDPSVHSNRSVNIAATDVGNPFEDDYDETKNPFAEDKPSNPFGEDEEEDGYDKNLNPFA